MSQASSRVLEHHVPWPCPPHGPKMASDSMSKGQQTHSWHLRQDFSVRERERDTACVFVGGMWECYHVPKRVGEKRRFCDLWAKENRKVCEVRMYTEWKKKRKTPLGLKSSASSRPRRQALDLMLGHEIISLQKRSLYKASPQKDQEKVCCCRVWDPWRVLCCHGGPSSSLGTIVSRGS